MIKGLEQIHPDDELFDVITYVTRDTQNTLHFAFESDDSKLDEDEIQDALLTVFEYADDISVQEAELDEELADEGKRYFHAVVYLWYAGITENNFL